MITAVDSSILFDVLLADQQYAGASLAALKDCRHAGGLVVCPVVWAEVRAALREPENMSKLLGAAGIRFDSFDEKCADLAGEMWRRYRARGGKRDRIIPDFLVGAHARLRAARLLSRDRGFYRGYFDGLEVIAPTM